ncbi:MAG TPA: hypothetical protein VHA57_10110 [Actinomycetota bacterium]|nr:hypothetical protein [Actinomycetota bacterium]
MSVLYRLAPGAGDPHPFSEVVGMLQRVATDQDGQRSFHICRRDGSVLAVREADVIAMKFIPTRPSGKVRIPPSWTGR